MDYKTLNNTYCFVCGYDFNKMNLSQVENYSICDCCLFQYAVDDVVYGSDAFYEYRTKWIDEGLPFRGELLPKDVEWTLKIALDQLKNIAKIDANLKVHEIKVICGIKWNASFSVSEIKKSWSLSRKKFYPS